MKKFQYDLILRIVKIIDVVMITLPFAGCWYLYYASRIVSPFYSRGNQLMVALFFVLYILIGRIYDGFWMSMQRISEIIYGQTLAAAVCDGIMYIMIWLLTKHLPSLWPGFAAFGLQILMAAAWAFLAHKWYFHTFPPHPTAIIYDERHGMSKLIDGYGLNGKYAVQKTAGVDECLADLGILDDVDTVFLSGIHSHDRNIILKYCIAKDINVFVIPRLGDGDIIGTTKKLPYVCGIFAA